MNILHINSYEKAGGAEQVATDLLNNPHVKSRLIVKYKKTADERILTFEQNSIDKLFIFIDKAIRKLRLNNTFKALLSITEKYNLTYSKLKRTAAYRQADIVHLHNIHGNYFDLDALIPIAREKKIVWTLHDMWPVTGGDFYTYGNLNFQKGIAKTSISFLAPLQQPLIDRRQYYLNRKGEIYNRIKDNITFVPVSNWLKSMIQSAFIIHPDFNVHKIYNGYDASKFVNKKLRTWTAPRVLFFNQTGESKASHLFTDGLEKLKNFDLYLIGERIHDSKLKYYRSYIDDRDELSNLFNDVDILVFPSKAESFGLLPLEAMACGVCVITSDSTALPEVVTQEWGYIFSSGNSRELHSKLQTALNNLERTRELGLGASIYALSNLNLNITYDAYYNLYKQILK